MTRKTRVILCNYIKGGAGKTTLAVHIAGILNEQTIRKILLVDCDPRPDSWKFFSGSRPDIPQKELSLPNNIDLRWNPPQSKGSRFKPITKRDWELYDYVVIDADSPPEDALTILSDSLPNIFLVPISESQSHAIEDISVFISDLEREIKFQQLTSIYYNPIIKVVPLGLSSEEIENELNIDNFSIQVEICTPMQSLAAETRKSLKEKKYIWKYANLENTKTYFIDLIKE